MKTWHVRVRVELFIDDKMQGNHTVSLGQLVEHFPLDAKHFKQDAAKAARAAAAVVSKEIHLLDGS